ncbi:unnamed protein product [Pleuronectes platessa]|uniref:THAP-type domain-containing protein n=1 Tax=Pleuronectes platessa TaxID=8262 RepID=A0A9N7VVA0_PLEPL|nr:unnamed protein product [Pleuronectes platessa]
MRAQLVTSRSLAPLKPPASCSVHSSVHVGGSPSMHSTQTMACCAVHCTNRPSHSSVVKFFRFHLGDPERLDLWVINMKRQNWILSLCSQHLSIDKRVTQTACTSGCPT